MNVAQYILTKCHGVIPETLGFWTSCLHFGHKTAALLLFAAFNIYTTIPVDSHARNALLSLNWSNGRTEEEISWQVQQWLPASHSDFFIKLNDSFGAIGQFQNSDHAARKKLLAWSANDPELSNIVHQLTGVK